MNNGARHHIDLVNPQSNLCLGSGPLNLDAENDGKPSVNADGDDTTMMDDEDGVQLPATLIAGRQTTIQVMAFDMSINNRGRLNAWIDFNADDDWNDAGEQVFTCQQLTLGLNTLTIDVPADAVNGATYARFRYSSICNLPYYGQAYDGEVEDYKVQIVGGIDGDLSGDGHVDIQDLMIFAGHWLRPCLPNPAACHYADIDGSGAVTISDFSRMSINWMK
jgi:hypothetical protein